MSDVKKLTLEEKLKLLEEKDKICNRVEAGERVPCPKCGAPLIFVTPNSMSEWADPNKNYEHGIFCSKDEEHFSRTMSFDILVKNPQKKLKND
ncbi:MAG TPA: hypothetical protein VF941_07950 [Clostridia bacterium]